MRKRAAQAMRLTGTRRGCAAAIVFFGSREVRLFPALATHIHVPAQSPQQILDLDRQSAESLPCRMVDGIADGGGNASESDFSDAAGA